VIIDVVPEEITREYTSTWPWVMVDETRGVIVGRWRFPAGSTVYLPVFSIIDADTPDTSNTLPIRTKRQSADTFMVSKGSFRDPALKLSMAFV
jgi:hypothetical protein